MSINDDADLVTIRSQLDRIERAIVGDHDMGHSGIVGRLDAVEARVNIIARDQASEVAQRQGALWVLSAAAAVAGALGGFISWILSAIQSRP